MQQLSVVAVLTGLTGIDWIGIRHGVGPRGQPLALPMLAFHPHDPKHAEHNFVFTHEDFAFGDGGAFEVVIEVQAHDATATGRFAFGVTRR